jgi:hypothetical protein
MAANAEQCGSTGDGMQYSCSWLHDFISKGMPQVVFHNRRMLLIIIYRFSAR